ARSSIDALEDLPARRSRVENTRTVRIGGEGQDVEVGQALARSRPARSGVDALEYAGSEGSREERRGARRVRDEGGDFSSRRADPRPLRGRGGKGPRRRERRERSEDQDRTTAENETEPSHVLLRLVLEKGFLGKQPRSFYRNPVGSCPERNAGFARAGREITGAVRLGETASAGRSAGSEDG